MARSVPVDRDDHVGPREGGVALPPEPLGGAQADDVEVAREAAVLEAVVDHDEPGSVGARAADGLDAVGADAHEHAGEAARVQHRLVARTPDVGREAHAVRDEQALRRARPAVAAQDHGHGPASVADTLGDGHGHGRLAGAPHRQAADRDDRDARDADGTHDARSEREVPNRRGQPQHGRILSSVSC